MKHLILVAITSVALVLVPVAVSAQTDSSTDTVNQETVESRVEKYKATVTERLSEAAESRLVRRCSGAQKILTRSADRFKLAVEKREAAYSRIHNKLVNISQRLEQSSIDPTSLDEEIAKYKVSLDKAIVSANEYQRIILDVSEMNCTEDPEGFKAALEVARQSRRNLIEEFKSLKDYIRVNVATQLQAIKKQVTEQVSDQEEGTL